MTNWSAAQGSARSRARCGLATHWRRQRAAEVIRFRDDRLGLRQEENNCEKEKYRLWCFDGSKSLPADSPGCLTTGRLPLRASGSAQSLGVSKGLPRAGRSEGLAHRASPRGSSRRIACGAAPRDEVDGGAPGRGGGPEMGNRGGSPGARVGAGVDRAAALSERGYNDAGAREFAPVTRMASKPLETVETRSDDSARAHDSASRRRSDHREPVALRPIGSAQAKRNRKRPSEGRWRGPASRRSGVAESCTFRRPSP